MKTPIYRLAVLALVAIRRPVRPVAGARLDVVLRHRHAVGEPPANDRDLAERPGTPALISLIAIVICGITLIWGGEIGEFAKKLVYVVMVIAVLVGASSLISTLFSSSGALV